MRDGDEEKARLQSEKEALDEDRRDLETRLELLRVEFERLDDYWQVGRQFDCGLGFLSKFSFFFIC